MTIYNFNRVIKKMQSISFHTETVPNAAATVVTGKKYAYINNLHRAAKSPETQCDGEV